MVEEAGGNRGAIRTVFWFSQRRLCCGGVVIVREEDLEE